MKKVLNIYNKVSQAWHIARDEGMSSLFALIGSRLLKALHFISPYGFTTMDDVLGWLKKHGQKYEVYSLDVFDTLLRRRIDPPELVKRLVADYISALLLNNGIATSTEEILAQRSRTEEALQREAAVKGEDADCSLGAVIAGTLKAVGADRIIDSKEIAVYEIELEKKALEPMPGALSVLTYLKSLNKRVICVSDSYLSTAQMASILENHGMLKYIDRVYVSSDIGRRKSTGRLFEYVSENECGDIVHIGDNYTSDQLIPKRLGIKALWLHSRSEKDRKKELGKLSKSKNKMNYVNAIIRSADKDNNELHRIGYDILGPALAVFIHNVAEQARKDGIEALFFIARDGYVMKKIYEILQLGIYADSSLPQGKYMCLGRLPVRTASLHKLTYAELSEVYAYMMRSPGKTATFGDILSSYGLEPSYFIQVAKIHGIDVDEPISLSTENTRVQGLLESNEFQDKVRGKGDEARALLRDYLISIGFMAKHHVAVVDANAEGMTQALLDRIFANEKGYPMVSRYYFNAVYLKAKRTDINLDLPQVKGIVSDWREDTEEEQNHFLLLGMFIELFSHPNHGVTAGYKRVNGRVIPLFRSTPQESQYQVTSQGLQGILDYARDYNTYYSLHKYRCEDLLEPMKRNIREWALFPPRRDVKALKGLFLTSDWPQESNHSLIGQIKFRDIVTVGGIRKQLRSSMWLQGTLALAPVIGLNWLARKAVKFKKQGRRLVYYFGRSNQPHNQR